MRVFIHGSCVSRDLLPLLSPHGFELTFYSPRQSLIGLLGPVPGIERAADLRALASRFQRRAAEGTLRADVIERLEHHHDETDMVLWDLTDERLGVYELNGGYVTRSLELMNAGLDTDLRREARHIPFGSSEHFSLWQEGLARWAQSLRGLRLDDRVVLLEPRWAREFEDGAPTPPSFGVSPDQHDLLARQYYAAARRALPAAKSIGSSITTSAATEHQWGPAPFHFSRPTSEELVGELIRLSMVPESEFPLPKPSASFIDPRTVRVETSRSWASDVALYVLSGGKIQAKFAYQSTTSFVVRLGRPGKYRFRAFHRLGSRKETIDSAEVELRRA